MVEKGHDCCPFFSAHMIHVYYIYPHLVSFHVVEYTSPMNPMGMGMAFEAPQHPPLGVLSSRQNIS